MAMLLRYHLSPKQMIVKQFRKVTFDSLVKQIRARFFESLAHPGEMVGILRPSPSASRPRRRR
jgi:hypothetical protein